MNVDAIIHDFENIVILTAEMAVEKLKNPKAVEKEDAVNSSFYVEYQPANSDNRVREKRWFTLVSKGLYSIFRSSSCSFIIFW